MGCFSAHKNRKRTVEQQPKTVSGPNISTGFLEAEGMDDTEAPRPVLSAPPSFKNRVRAIQHAQRFINSNPRLRSSHPGYGRRDRDGHGGLGSSALSAIFPLGGRARSETELGSVFVEVSMSSSLPMEKRTPCGRPMPLPSPQPSSKPSCYRLPLPEQISGPLPDASPPSMSPPLTSPKLPLSPSRSGNHGSGPLKGLMNVSTKIHASDPQPLPPPPLEPVAGLRSFVYEEIAAACNNFSPDRRIGDGGASPVYMGVIKCDKKGQKHMEVTVARICERWQQGHKEWLEGLSIISLTHGAYLCKVIGFHAEEGSKERLLVYERLAKGSLDSILYGKTDSPPLDWPSRLKIALGAAQGLAYLHGRTPEPIVYKLFRTSHIAVDMDFSSKLCGYGFANCNIDSDNPSNAVAKAYLAPEMWNGDHASPKSNVWSFGVVLLELLTGRQNMDPSAPKEERNLVKWTKPFLMDEGRLFLIMDPKLQGRFPAKGAKMMADLALQCLETDPLRRPTMKEALDVVKPVQEMRYTCRFSLKEPTTSVQPGAQVPAASLQVGISTSGGTSKAQAVERSVPKRIPTKFDLIESPPLRPLIIPPRSCACTFALEEVMTRQREYSSQPLERLESF